MTYKISKKANHITLVDNTKIVIHEDIFTISEFAYMNISNDELAETIKDFNKKNKRKYRFDTDPKIIFQDLKEILKQKQIQADF